MNPVEVLLEEEIEPYNIFELPEVTGPLRRVKNPRKFNWAWNKVGEQGNIICRPNVVFPPSSNSDNVARVGIGVIHGTTVVLSDGLGPTIRGWQDKTWKLTKPREAVRICVPAVAAGFQASGLTRLDLRGPYVPQPSVACKMDPSFTCVFLSIEVAGFL